MTKNQHRILTAVLVIVLSFCNAAAEDAAAEGKSCECAVLLHGLARTEASLSKLEHYLENKGFMVVNMGYPSRHKTVQELSAQVMPAAIEQCTKRNACKIHFVTHSMGGILVRYYIEHNAVPGLGRVVMLSPPNSGSEVVDKFKGTRIFEWLYGPAGMQLGTGEGSIPRALGAPDYEVGIITGDRSINPILSLLIPGSDDGKVSVENAKLQGMKDFLVVHKTHPFIMNDKVVIQQVSGFIMTGAFDHD